VQCQITKVHPEVLLTWVSVCWWWCRAHSVDWIQVAHFAMPSSLVYRLVVLVRLWNLATLPATLSASTPAGWLARYVCLDAHRPCLSTSLFLEDFMNRNVLISPEAREVASFHARVAITTVVQSHICGTIGHWWEPDHNHWSNSTRCVQCWSWAGY